MDQNQVYGERFGGTGRLYGQQGVDQLRQAKVAVVGIGGVGSWVAEALARTGIGSISLVDLDDVCVSNINRQIHALDGQVGRLKVSAMAERIKAINPTCEVSEVADFVTPDNVDKLITGDFHYVVDAIDSVKPKAALINHCVRNKIAIITTGGAGGQTDPLQITRGDLSKTTQDPLAKKVRQLLRKHYGFSKNPKRKFGVECIFSTEPLVYPQPDGSVCGTKSVMENGTRLDCAGGFGAAAMVTASFGFAAAARVVEKLTQPIGA
mgnify:CR=1 FL=1